MGWPPIGLARIAEIGPEQEGCAPKLGRLESPDGIFTGPGEVADGFVFHWGDRDGGKIP
jgi:hypothetical protein